MTTLILLLLVALGGYTMFSPRLIRGVWALSAFSLLSALLFYLLRAPDVAITEAAVGAGVSTLIYLWALKALDKKDGEP